MPSYPADADQALARDDQLAKRHRTAVRKQFRRELPRLVASRGRSGVRVQEWEKVLADMWVSIGEDVVPAYYQHLTGTKLVRDARQKQQLVALIDAIINAPNSAQAIATFVEEASAGIVKTTRRRIQTVLRQVGRPSDVRRVTRAIRRLYRTDFVRDRANRIALDQVLRATATYENAAAMLAQETTGFEYVKIWRTQGDARVRSTHVEAAGQEVALDEGFKVGGALLRYPRDLAGPASETYGCRCWTERKRLPNLT